MAISPSTRVYLLSTPLDPLQKNQIRFTSLAAQIAYFTSPAQIKHDYTNFQYSRKDSILKIPVHVDVLYDSNYVMYKNEGHGDKWFYAFITKMEYINDSCTAVHIKTDVYQTWLFDVTLKQSFVVREHVSNDTRGLHLLDEGLDYGEYKMRTYTRSNYITDYCFMVGVSDLKPYNGATDIGNVYGNIFSGLAYIAFDSAHVDALRVMLRTYADAGKIDAVVVMFVVPKELAGSGFSFNGGIVPNGNGIDAAVHQIQPTFTDLDGYTPKNNKMYCYPYNLLYVSNNQGGSSEYRFEDFVNPETYIQFEIWGNLSPNSKVVCVPLNYRGVTNENWEYALGMGDFPLCSWGNDVFANWLAQNKVGMVTSTAAAGLAIGAGIATANPIMIGGGAMAVANEMAQLYKASTQPDQAKGNVNGGTLNVAMDKQDFFFSHMTIKAEFAKRIDQYFDMYGYKVNEVKIPNVSGRPYWNYVQTIDMNITGGIPADDMTELKKIYNDGVTLWHNAANFCDYSLNNH